MVRVHRSFAFVDVSGFTALTELEGDERAVEVLTAFRSLLREICSRRGVRIAKWLGDGVMLVCVETPPLLATILELHFVVANVPGPAESLSIRSGVTSGYVILMEGDDYIGHCVNVAARLCDLADGGEALASPSVMDYLPRWGLTLSHRDVTLRGVEKPVEAASIGMPALDQRQHRDPICGLPLTEVTAEETADDPDGGVAALLFSRLPRHLGATTHELRGGPRRSRWASLSQRGVLHLSPSENVPLCIIRLWDAELVDAETMCSIERDVRAIAYLDRPTSRRLLGVTTPNRDPLGAVGADSGATVCIHVDSPSGDPIAAHDPHAAVRDLLSFPKPERGSSEGRTG